MPSHMIGSTKVAVACGNDLYIRRLKQGWQNVFPRLCSNAYESDFQ